MKKAKVDLDVSNYNLEDMLELLDMPIHFSESDLKRAKGIVLKTHPDKSGLHPDYFRFYSKVYKMIYSVWEFKKKGDVNNTKSKNTDYISSEGEYDKKEILDTFFNTKTEFKDKSKFNAWFNEQFNKNKLYNESQEKGYGDWLRNEQDGDDNTPKNITMANMGDEFEKRKHQARSLSLVNKQDIQELWGNNNTISATELSNEAPSVYDSGLFSNLGFQDLQKAYTETVIPVTYEDYEKRDKFKSVDEFMRHRGSQDTKPLSEQQSLDFLKNKERANEEMATKRAYDLAKQSEQFQVKNKEFWSKIQTIGF